MKLSRPKTLPDNAGLTAVIRALLTNPVDAWLEKAYTESSYKIPFFGRSLIYVSDPAVVQAVLLDYQKLFPKGPVEKRILKSITGDGMFTVHGPVWRRQRRATSGIFRQRHLATMVPVMTRSAEDSADRLRDMEPNLPFNVHDEMIAATYQIIHYTLLAGGDGVIDEQETATAIDQVLQSVGKPDPFDLLGLPPSVPRPWGMKARAAVRSIQKNAQRCIDHRLEYPGSDTDLLQLMLDAGDPKSGQTLDNIEIRDNLLTFIAAGHETTALALTWSIYLLALHPEWQSRIRREVRDVCGREPIAAEHISELDTVARVLNESMRLYPPVPAIDRVATEDIDVGELRIAKGDFVILGILPMHRHERLWNYPDRFDPDRFAPDLAKSRHRFAFIPFSGGPRVCIGARFAMMEACCILGTLVRDFDFELENPDEPVELVSRVTLRPKGGLSVIARPSASPN